MSQMGLVSRVSPVHTAVCNCTRDEGGPFEVGNQLLISSHRKLLWSKSHGGERCGKSRNKNPAGMIERGERKVSLSFPCGDFADEALGVVDSAVQTRSEEHTSE